MENFVLQIKTICLVSILTGVLGCLIPECKLKKAFNRFCAVVIVFAVLMPLSSFGKNADKAGLSGFDRVRGEVSLQNETAEKMIYTAVLESALNERFSEAGISATVAVECEKTDDSYKIAAFTVSAAASDDKDKAALLLNEGFNGIPVYFKEE